MPLHALLVGWFLGSKEATKPDCRGQDIPCAPNKRTGGFVIGSVIAPIFFNTMEDSGALPIEMDVKDMGMGDLIDLYVYEQKVKAHGTNDVITEFKLKHELMLDQAGRSQGMCGFAGSRRGLLIADMLPISSS